MMTGSIALHLYLILCPLYCMIMNNQDGNTALHVAANKGHADTVKLLLENGADIKAMDKVSHCEYVYVHANCSTKYSTYYAVLRIHYYI